LNGGGLAEEQRIDRSVDCGGEGVWAFARGRGGAAGCLRRSVRPAAVATHDILKLYRMNIE
jgi:hypothetical protein